jgi:hypothetical protein
MEPRFVLCLHREGSLDVNVFKQAVRLSIIGTFYKYLADGILAISKWKARSKFTEDRFTEDQLSRNELKFPIPLGGFPLDEMVKIIKNRIEPLGCTIVVLDEFMEPSRGDIQGLRFQMTVIKEL